MKYILVVTALLTLAACKDERHYEIGTSGRDYRIECIGGIEYWQKSAGHAGVLAVRIDPETMTYVRC